MSLTRRRALGLLAGAALVATAAAADTYPSRVIKMVVPYPPGGPTDVIARIVAEELGKSFGQNVIVENLAGAAGAIGTRTVAKAEADGYTLIFGNNQTHGNNMFLLANPGYDAIKDFAPLAGAGAFEHVFVTSNQLPAKAIPDLVALAKKEPGKLNYGSTGLGSGSHLATELFMVRTGARMTHVPFRGAAPLVQELIAGRIDVSNSTLPSVLGQNPVRRHSRHRDREPAADALAAEPADAARAGHRRRRRGILVRLLCAGRRAAADSREGLERDPGDPPEARREGAPREARLHDQGAKPAGVSGLPREGDADLGGHHPHRRHQARDRELRPSSGSGRC